MEYLRLIPFDVEAICAHQGRLIHGLFVRCAQRIFPLRSGFACTQKRTPTLMQRSPRTKPIDTALACPCA